jgi:hypothetical protein
VEKTNGRVWLFSLVMSLGMTMAAGADTINLSMNPADWYRYPVVIGSTNYNSAPAVIEQTTAGHLRGTNHRHRRIELDSRSRDF